MVSSSCSVINFILSVCLHVCRILTVVNFGSVLIEVFSAFFHISSSPAGNQITSNQCAATFVTMLNVLRILTGANTKRRGT